MENISEVPMFDPTVYDNLKVVLEGGVYDLDLSGDIEIIGRSDRVELSTMSRSFSILFQLTGESMVSGQLILFADTKNLSAEILELPDIVPGCNLNIAFNFTMKDMHGKCALVEEELRSIWGYDVTLRQEIRTLYGDAEGIIRNRTTVGFVHPVTEAHINDFGNLIRHVVQSLDKLNQIVQ